MNMSHKGVHHVHAAVARIAANQHGVVSLTQLLALGLTRADAAHRVRIGFLHASTAASTPCVVIAAVRARLAPPG
jgi:hypothetical protein